MKDAFSRLVGRTSAKQRSAPGSSEQSPDNSPRVMESGSPRKASLLDPRNRARSRSVAGFNNSPRTAASMEYLWLLRPETRAAVETACKNQDAKCADSLVAFVERCLFSNRVSEQDKVRDLAYAAPSWGGSGQVLRVALESFSRYDRNDQQIVGPSLLSSILAWVEFDSGPSLNAVFHEMVARICALVDGGETWQHKIISALEHASKTYRPAPILFPSLAPSETVRLQFVDLLDVDRLELADEIVHLVWRIFLSIRPTEWSAFVWRYGPVKGKDDEGGLSCDNLLSLIQLTKSLQHWIVTTLCMRRDKSKVALFWINIADLVLSSNCHHAAIAIADALQDTVVEVFQKEHFSSQVLAGLDRLKDSIRMSVSSRCDVYLANATVSCMSTDRRPFVPPLKLLLDSIAECLDLENERIAAERLTGMVQFIMYVQQGVRYFGVSPIPLSHDAYDLLLEMPLLPKPLLDAVVVLYKLGLSEPDSSLLDSESEHRSSDTMSSDRQSVTPPLQSPKQKKTPSPSRSPSQTPRANYTPRGSSTGRSGSDRADLGLSISYRVLAQRGGKPAQQLPKFILYASASGLIRMEDEPYKGAENEMDLLKFSFCGGELKVLWVKGLEGLARLLCGTTVLGFLPRVIDDVLFAWRCVFTKPSVLLRLIIAQYSDIPLSISTAHLFPDQIFALHSVRRIRKNVLYVIKRLVDIERSNMGFLTEDRELIDAWGLFFQRLKAGTTPSRTDELKRSGSNTSESSARSSLSSSPSKTSSAGLPVLRGFSSASLTQTFAGNNMDEFVCGSSIEWTLRNGKTRVQIPTVPPPPDFIASTSEGSVAEALTVVEQNAFCGVGVGELLGFQSESSAHNWLKWVVSRFNATSEWVAKTVLTEEDLAKRVSAVLFFMRLAVVALSVGNVSLCFAVYSGLESMPVSRLKSTWKKVGAADGKKNVLTMFENLRDLFSPESGQSELRNYHLANMSKIRVPFVGLWTKDVFLIDRNNPTYFTRENKRTVSVEDCLVASSRSIADSNNGGIVPPIRSMREDDILNVDKLSMIADSVCRVIFFQGNELSPQLPSREVVDPISNSGPTMTEDMLYELSQKIEPKKNV